MATRKPKLPGKRGKKGVAKSLTKRNGPPPIEIDLDVLLGLAQIQCTIEEAASVLRIAKRTLIRHLKKYPETEEAWEAGKARGRVSLRRLQWKHAQGTGSSAVQMTIHLSKHILGETEKSLVQLGGKDGGPIPFVDINALRGLTDEELAQLVRLTRKVTPGAVGDTAGGAGEAAQ